MRMSRDWDRMELGHNGMGTNRTGALSDGKGRGMGLWHKCDGPQWEERDEDGDTMGLWHNWTGAEWADPDVAQRSITKTKNRALYICQRGGHLSKPRERVIAGF